MASSLGVRFQAMRVESRDQRLIIEAIYWAWAVRDFATIGACIDDDTEWLVHLPPGAWPLSGSLSTKPKVMQSLRAVARDFEVLEYEPLKIVQLEDFWQPRGRKRAGVVFATTKKRRAT